DVLVSVSRVLERSEARVNLIPQDAPDTFEHFPQGLRPRRGTSERAQPFAPGTDGVIRNFNRMNVRVFRGRKQTEKLDESLDPSLLAISDENFRVPVVEYVNPRPLEPRLLRQGVIRREFDFNVSADRREVTGVLLRHSATDSGSHHQKIEQFPEVLPRLDVNERAIEIS